MAGIPNRLETTPGAKYSPNSWSNIHKEGAPIVGWGIAEKLPTERFYKPIAWKGQIHPFATKKDAQKFCNELVNPTPKPKCAVRGVLMGGRAMCGSIGCGTWDCHSPKPCEHKLLAAQQAPA